MVMASNVVYEALNKDLPFSFVPSGIELLNKEIYLVVSDDLAQNSLLNKFSLREIISLPLTAGVDILIFSGWRLPVEKGVQELKEAVKEGDVKEETVDKAALRIIKLKQSYFNLF